MRRKKIGKQTFQAGFAELAAHVRQLEQVIQIVDRVPDGAHFAQLFFGGFEMLLYLFELGKAFLNILIKLVLHLLGDFHKLGINPVANAVKALRRFLVQAVEFGL